MMTVFYNIHSSNGPFRGGEDSIHCILSDGMTLKLFSIISLPAGLCASFPVAPNSQPCLSLVYLHHTQ
jgi:hypothetical protein